MTATGTTTAKEPVPATTVRISSPAFKEDKAGLNPVSARYTCLGTNTSLPLSWERVPTGTAQVVITVFKLQHNAIGPKPFVDWSLSITNPGVHAVPTGRVPTGVVGGRNSVGKNGYYVCPSPHTEQHYGLALYALRKRIPVSAGYDSVKLFRTAGRVAPFQGLAGFYYTRR
jgi:phosphatidylethanolamine-binding protein (PEBP) family uncharacterized protein